MKKMRKIYSLLLIAVMCIGLLPVHSLTAKAESTLNYLALGDSITTGYGLSDPGTQGYVPLFAAAVGATSTTNNAVGGQVTDGLLSSLYYSESYQNDIMEADVITITIGGNDMTYAFYDLIAQICNENSEYTITAAQVKSAFSYPAGNYSTIALIYTLLTENDFSSELYSSDSETPTEFEEAISTCVENINTIAAEIKELNPDVTIMVANQYNSYYWFTGCDNFVKFLDTGVNMYNAALEANNSDDYTVVDVYSAFIQSETSLLNAQLDTVNFTVVNFDFHPNAAGHQKIAETFAAVYENIKPVTDTIAPSISGIEDGQTYCGAVEATVTDTNLDTVTIDGELQTLNENGAFTISSEGTHIITATDQAGNVSSVEITVHADHAWAAPTWIWDGFTSATATFICSNNPEHSMNVSADESSVTYTVTKEATCSESGTGTYTAAVTVNGVEYTSSVEETIPAAGHSYETEWTTDENAHWHVCSVCGEITDYQQHTYSEWITTAEPTMDAAGTRVHTCTVCGYEATEEIGQLITYTLSFETNGGNTLDNVVAAAGSTVDLSDYVPSRSGYKFAGWYADKALTEKITSVTLDTDTTVYASWTKTETVKPNQTHQQQVETKIYQTLKQVYSLLSKLFR